MKKLLGILAVVALFAMIAAPAMAGNTSTVTINVGAYATVSVGNLPAFTVTGLQADNNYATQHADTTITAVSNTAFKITVTADRHSGSAIQTPGSPPSYVGDQWPTAYIDNDDSVAANGLGFGFGITDTSQSMAGQNGGYSPAEGGAAGNAKLTGRNAGTHAITLSAGTYLDSGRSGAVGPNGGQLAKVGTYTATLTVTIAAE